MLYDANLRFKSNDERLIQLDFTLLELIRRNIAGTLGEEGTLKQLVVAHTDSLKQGTFDREVIFARGDDEDSLYCLGDNKATKYEAGGFVFENETLYFAPNMINLSTSRDSYRQGPLSHKGNYVTDDSFRDTMEQFRTAKVPLFLTSNLSVTHDRTTWPNKSVPNLGDITYDKAYANLGL